jgi:hypothetical protein
MGVEERRLEMSVAGKLRTAAALAGRTGYYLGVRPFTKPREAKAFARRLANAVATFHWYEGIDWVRKLPKATLDAIYPGIGEQVVNMRFTPYTTDELPLGEYGAIGAAARYLAPRNIFEIGTHRGRTALLMAENTPESTTVYTLNQPPADMAKYFNGMTTEQAETALGEAFRGKPAASKIVQLIGDSRTFDFSPYTGQMDIIFIDADHSYEGIKNDTERALPMLKPGGTIVWDDYNRAFPGIIRYLEEFAATGRRVVRIAGTRLGWYRHQPNGSAA